jgi:hypothetical protein
MNDFPLLPFKYSILQSRNASSQVLSRPAHHHHPEHLFNLLISDKCIHSSLLLIDNTISLNQLYPLLYCQRTHPDNQKTMSNSLPSLPNELLLPPPQRSPPGCIISQYVEVTLHFVQ